MNYLIYENALPILEEYEAPEALGDLLKKHDEFSEGLIGCITKQLRLN